MADEQQVRTRPGRNGGTLQSGGAKNQGRRKKVPSLEALVNDLLGKDEDDESGVSDIEHIVTALAKNAKKGDVAAAKLLLEYTYGKAVQTIKAEVENKVTTYALPDGTVIEV